MLLNVQALAQHANCGERGAGNTGRLRGKGEALPLQIRFELHSTLAAFHAKTCSVPGANTAAKGPPSNVTFGVMEKSCAALAVRERSRRNYIEVGIARERGSAIPEPSPPHLFREVADFLTFQ